MSPADLPAPATLADLIRRYASVLLALVAGALLTVLVLGYDRLQTRQEVERQLVWRADNQASRFQRTLERSQEVVDALANFMTAANTVDREAFRRFVQPLLQAHPEILALEWLPRLTQARDAGKDAASHALPPTVEPAPDGTMGQVFADAPSAYYPARHAESLPADVTAMGIDTLSWPSIRTALEQARDHGLTVISEEMALAQSGKPARAVALYRPVYRRDAPSATVAQRRAAHLGYAVGMLRVGSILDGALKGYRPSGLDVLIVDRTGGDWQVLHAHASRSRGPHAPQPTLKDMLAGPHHTVRLEVPGRDWRMLFRPAPAFHAEFRNDRWVWILILGSLATVVLATYLGRRVRATETIVALNDELSRLYVELARQSQRLQQAQLIARLGCWELDLATRQAQWSPAACQSLGYAPGTCMVDLEDFFARVHPEERRGVEAALQVAAEDGQSLDLVHRAITPAGEERWFHLRAEPIRDDEGRAVRLLGTLLDVTDSVRGAERLRLTARVIDSTHDAVVITDRKLRILEVNPAFARITGYGAEEVIGQKPSLWKSDYHDEAFYAKLREALRSEGHWQGEIWNRRRNGEVYPTWQTISAVRDDQGEVTHYVSVFSDISDIVRTRTQLAHLAQHDALTDLPNRLLFLDRLQHALARARREQGRLAVLFLDLDRFKHINDSLGHATGDRLLLAVASRLRSTVRKEDTVARMGGDEFILLLEDLRQEEDAAHLAQKLIKALAEPYHLDGREFFVTGSIGISLYPRDGDDAQTLVRNADAAMYRAKTQGRNAYDFYDAALTVSAMERVRLETELRQALARGELSVHYQLQVELASGRPIGAEALLRWQHPELGQVAPDRFIPLAEETGLIIEIGAWVLREACRQAHEWLQAGLPIETMAVNVAGPQIQRSDFVASVRQALTETGLPARNLELEVTESFIMGQAEGAIGVLEALSQLGVQLAIDDFGTGYSSLAYLKRLPIDKLKVDRSFVRDLPADEEDAAIAAAVIALGRSLGLKVIAEGVETAAQRDFLMRLGCDQAQGWYYGRPQPPDRFSLALAA